MKNRGVTDDMFVNDRIVYLQLHKTGCTHISSLLKRHVGGTQDLKHARFTDEKDNRLVLGSVRNPWAWYVSLWAYGCKRLGSVYNSVTRSRWQHLAHQPKTTESALKSLYWRTQRALRSGGRASQWRSCYENSDDPELFRSWIKLMFNSAGKRDLTEGYPYSLVSKFAGLMTYRYCDLYCSWTIWRRQRMQLSNLAELEEFDRGAFLVDYMIRTESLEDDLLAALERAGYSLDRSAIASIRGAARSNASSHRPYTDYYDDRTVELVNRNEALIIRKYGYEFGR